MGLTINVRVFVVSVGAMAMLRIGQKKAHEASTLSRCQEVRLLLTLLLSNGQWKHEW